MTTQFSDASIRDFLRIFSHRFTPCGVNAALRDCIRVLPALRQADTETGEECVVAAFASLHKGGKLRWCHALPLLRQIIEELCHYPEDRREALLRAALAASIAPAGKETTFVRMRPRVLLATQNLDDRTKAIIVAMETLRRADSETSGTAYYCGIPDELGDVDVDILRADATLAPLIEAYDMANVILEGRQ